MGLLKYGISQRPKHHSSINSVTKKPKVIGKPIKDLRTINKMMRMRNSMRETGNVVIVIAIDRNKNSQSAVRWAVENLLKKSSLPHCTLIHVRCQTMHPNDADYVPKGGRPPTEAELKQFFLPFRGFCARKGISATEVVLHDIDVPSALIDYVTSNSIVNIVVGASSRNAIIRKFRNPDVATSLLKLAPEFCSVYVIGKDKIQTARYARQPQPPRSDAGSDTSSKIKKSARWRCESDLHSARPDTYDVTRSTPPTGSPMSMNSDGNSSARSCDFPSVSPYGWRQMGSSAKPMDSYISQSSATSSDLSDFSVQFSYQSSDCSSIRFSSVSGSSMASLSVSESQRKIDEEMAKLQLEFKQSLSVYNMACQDLDNIEKARDVRRINAVEIRDLEDDEVPNEAARFLSATGKPPLKPSPVAKLQSETENQRRHSSPDMAVSKLKERQSGASDPSATKNGVVYKKYPAEEIEAATDYFSDLRKIGEGGYGPVYKAMLDNMPVAIKALSSDVSQGLRQFQQEVEVLSGMRHPNMVHLVGACPEYGCLVYEYMDYGSLEDRLFCKDNTPPIPWRARFQIAAEIATGLLFLHQQPEPLVHRDIKPSNILLDKTYKSKIGDVGLARLVPASMADKVTQYHLTAAAGTFCYIDPEYQQTGMLGVKSDVYSLGVVLLQILTSKPPMGLAMWVEGSIEDETFDKMLDPDVTDWPVEAAESLAKLALQCCELRRKDRPDLASVILPELNRLKDLNLELKDNVNENKDDSDVCSGDWEPETRSKLLQMNRRRKQLLKPIAGLWDTKRSFKGPRFFTRRKSLKEQDQQVAALGCWSLANCSRPKAHVRRINSLMK